MEKTLTRKERKSKSRIHKVNYWVAMLNANVHNVVDHVMPYNEVHDTIVKSKKRARYHIRVLAKYGTWDDEGTTCTRWLLLLWKPTSIKKWMLPKRSELSDRMRPVP